MKKLLFLFAILIFTGRSFGQAEASVNKNKPTLDASAVPASVQKAYTTENPALDATWRTEGKNYKAEYVDDSNVAHARVYDASGNILYRDDEMSNYPAPITDYYNQTYPGEGFMIWSRIDNAGVTKYYAYHNSEMVWFDKDGKSLNPKRSKSAAANIKMK